MFNTPRFRAPRTAAALRARRFVAVLGLSSVTLCASLLPRPAVAGPKTVRAAMVRVETARLRKGPSDSHKPSGLLDAGRKAKVIGSNGEWAKVRLESGTEGWVRRDLLSVSRKRVRIADNDNAAKQKAAKRAHLKRLAAANEAASEQKAAKRAHLKRLAAINAEAKHNKAVATAAQAKRNKIVAARNAAHNRVVRLANAQNEVRNHAARVALLAKRAEIAKQVAKARAEQAAINQAARLAAQQANARAHAEKAARNAAAREAARVARAARNEANGITGAAARVGEKSAAAASRAASLAYQTRESEASNAQLETARSSYSPAAPVAVAQPSPAPSPQARVRESISAPRTVILPLSSSGKVSVPVPPAMRSGASVDRSSSRGDNLIRTALSFRGTPYRMGATGRGAFDCSGFVRYIFAQQGSALPRTAAEQYTRGLAVGKNDMQPGDLVFFKNTYKRGVSHVGMYLGNGQFVHASSGRHAVTVSNLSDSYYQNHWAGARRPR